MDPKTGYPPQQGGYPPQQAGYPAQPPAGAYPPPYGQAPPPTNAGYNQPYGAPPSNVVVVGGQPQQTIIVERHGVNHVLHFCISLFFWPWVIVWIILCITDDGH